MKPIALLLYCLFFAQNCICQTFRIQVDDGSWRYANLQGEIVVPSKYMVCGPFAKEGLAPIYNREKKKVYFIDTAGNKLHIDLPKYLIKDGFGYAPDGFKDGLVPIRTGGDWGYLNSEGKLAIAAKYSEAMHFNEGYGIARLKGLYMVLDKSGNETPVQVFNLKDVKPFREGFAPFKDQHGMWGYLNRQGKIGIEPKFTGVGYFTGGLAWARNATNDIGFIDTTGKWLILPVFEVANDFDPVSGMAKVKTTNGWGYVGKNGSLLYVNNMDYLGDFSEGLALGGTNGKMGYFGKDGKWVIAPQFKAGRDFKNGFASVEMHGKWGLINTKGEWVITPRFSNMKDVELIL